MDETWDERAIYVRVCAGQMGQERDVGWGWKDLECLNGFPGNLSAGWHSEDRRILQRRSVPGSASLYDAVPCASAGRTLWILMHMFVAQLLEIDKSLGRHKLTGVINELTRDNSLPSHH
ncbi:hypothetical protein QQF64_029182 [Cirrhinus molitorella]|uniref:Uncharacterized protein n=1 Tax=Cirrhinus molitorella TaxID=172907 RepID=A0ABR3N8Q8_9TELE